jgi:ubiquinone/menaquinone biosynthesis C-methylase UbiE
MNTSLLRNWHQKLLAWGMAKANQADESRIKLKNCQEFASMEELKRSLLGALEGTIVEIGPGAGTNLAYYPKGVRWIGVEPNRFMHPYIYRQAESSGLRNIEIRAEQADGLQLEDCSIDAVVSTYVLCSVSDIDDTLKTIRRILRPGGSFIFLEHVAAPDGTCTRLAQDGATPVWQTVFDGCHPNRETWIHLDHGGFKSVRYQFFRLSVPIVSPHIAGIATR